MRLWLDKNLSKDILKLAVPVVTGMLFQTMVNLADTIMVGRISDPVVSVAGMAAIGITIPLFWAVGGFLSALNVGTQAMTARRYGEGNPRRAAKVLMNSATLGAVLSITAAVVMVLLVPVIFPFFNDNPEVIKHGVPYAQTRFAAVTAMVLTQVYKAFFDGLGKTYVAMVASIVMNALNIGLNFLLVFGIWGFPELGVLGAGIGSMISSFIGLGIVIGWSMIPSIRRLYPIYRLSNWDGYVMKEVVRLSFPGGIATIFVMSGFLMFLKIMGIVDHSMWVSSFPVEHAKMLAAHTQQTMGRFAAQGVPSLFFDTLPYVEQIKAQMRMPLFTAGSKIIVDLMSISFMAAMAQGTATATLVSQSLGRNEPQKAAQYGWESVRLACLFMGSLGVLEAIFPAFFLGLFTDKQPVIDASMNTMRLLGGINFMVASALVFMQSLFGAGNTRFVMYVEMTLHMVCLVPLAYLFGIVFELGMVGTWAAAAMYITILCLILGWKWWEGKWKYIKI